MVFWGIREQAQDSFLYRFYESDREYCQAEEKTFRNIQSVMIRKPAGSAGLSLHSILDADATLYSGFRRYVVDKSDGHVFGTLELSEGFSTRINKRILVDDRAHIIRFWDCERPDEPVALINLEKDPPLVKRCFFVGKQHCYLFCCDDAVDENTRLLMMLYPALRIA